MLENEMIEILHFNEEDKKKAIRISNEDTGNIEYSKFHYYVEIDGHAYISNEDLTWKQVISNDFDFSKEFKKEFYLFEKNNLPELIFAGKQKEQEKITETMVVDSEEEEKSKEKKEDNFKNKNKNQV